MHSKLSVLELLREFIINESNNEDLLNQVNIQNPWFIPSFTQKSLLAIVEMLDSSSLVKWTSNYNFSKTLPQRLGLVLAGNIPLVGFHDLLCAYLSPHSVFLKISSKDSFLVKYFLSKWIELAPEFGDRIKIVERLEAIDMIIATGSESTYSYFSYYFKKYKHILRKNRTSVAYIPASISNEELALLADDIFLYFGFGCRNVGKLYIQRGMDLERLLKSWDKYHFLFEHSKYMNNYDYQRTLLLLNQTPHLATDFAILNENPSVFSPISTVHYQWVEDEVEMAKLISPIANNIQCVVSPKNIPYGQSQQPTCMDYADGVDVMEFLLNNEKL